VFKVQGDAGGTARRGSGARSRGGEGVWDPPGDPVYLEAAVPQRGPKVFGGKEEVKASEKRIVDLA